MLRSGSVVLVCVLALEGQLSCQEVASEPLTSTFNGVELDTRSSSDEYSFVVIGHLRSNPDRQGPARSLRENVARLNATQPRVVIGLGDLYYNTNSDHLNEFRDWTKANLAAPFFNAVGNHDIQIGADLMPDGSMSPRVYVTESYVKEFGPTYFDFTIGSELFLILDFETRGYVLAGEQLDYFHDVVRRAAEDDSIRNVFVFSHKVFWSYNRPALEPVFRYRHPVPVEKTYDVFDATVKPALFPLTKTKRVYLFAGDIGGGHQYLQMYYHQDDDFTYVATGLGAYPRDCFVKVSVNDGKVELTTVILTTGEEWPCSRFDNAHWEAYYAEHAEDGAAVDRLAPEKPEIADPEPTGK